MPLVHERSRIDRSVSTSRAGRTTTPTATGPTAGTSSHTATAAPPAVPSVPSQSHLQRRHPTSSATAPTASSAAKATSVRSSSRLRQASASRSEHPPVPSAPIRRPPSSRIRSQRQASRAGSAQRDSSPTGGQSTVQQRTIRPASSTSTATIRSSRSRSRIRSGTQVTKSASSTLKSRQANVSTTAAATTPVANAPALSPKAAAAKLPPTSTTQSDLKNDLPSKGGMTGSTVTTTSGCAALATPPSSAVSILEPPPILNNRENSRENMFVASHQDEDDSVGSDSDNKSVSDSAFLGIQSTLPRVRNSTRRRGRAEDGSLACPMDGTIFDHGCKLAPPPTTPVSAVAHSPSESRPIRDRDFGDHQQQNRQHRRQHQQQQQRLREQNQKLSAQPSNYELEKEMVRRREWERLCNEHEAKEKESRASRGPIIDTEGDFRVPELWVTNSNYSDVEIGGLALPGGLRSAKMRESLGDDEDAWQDAVIERESYMVSIQDFQARRFQGTVKDLHDALNASLKAKVLALDDDDWVFEGD